MKRLGLTQQQTLQLIDALRRQMLYQTPQPVFAPGAEADEPLHVLVKMKPASYGLIMQLIAKAGGWELPPEAKRDVLKAHEERARKAFGNGKDYDFSALSHGELYSMHTELDGIDLDADLLRFKEAVGEEIKDRSAASDPGQQS